MRRGDWQLEVLYVDSGSNDNSVEIAHSLGVQAIVLHPERPTAALARNAGWRAATGDFVLFLDGDTILDESFVLDSLSEFADVTIACVWGHRRELHPGHSLYNRVLDLDWVYAPGFTPFCGGDAIFRHSALDELGGFDETLIAGEEPELCRRILGAGQKILHVDRPMTKHDLAITRFTQYWRRATRAGHAFAEVSQRFAATDNPFWTDEVRRNRNRAVALCAIPVAALGMSLAIHAWWPLPSAIAVLVLLVLRSAWKARWKSSDTVALLQYGAHSHLQQLPIAWGQLQFFFHRRSGRRVGLVEYKQASATKN